MPVDLSEYPPPHHMLRDLALEFEHRPGGESHAWLPLATPVATPAGHARVGVLATAVDALAGGLAALAAAPGWIATADLTLHLARAIPVSTGRSIEIVARVARAGRTTVVLEATIDDGATRSPAAFATMTFSVLERRDSNPVVVAQPADAPPVRQALLADGSGFARDAYEQLGLRVVAGGVVELTPSPYVVNSLGAVQGGALASLAELAGTTALGDGYECADLHLVYLALAKEGPVRAQAEVLARDAASGTAAVLVDDLGAARRTTRATVTAVQW